MGTGHSRTGRVSVAIPSRAVAVGHVGGRLARQFVLDRLGTGGEGLLYLLLKQASVTGHQLGVELQLDIAGGSETAVVREPYLLRETDIELQRHRGSPVMSDVNQRHAPGRLPARSTKRPAAPAARRACFRQSGPACDCGAAPGSGGSCWPAPSAIPPEALQPSQW